LERKRLLLTLEKEKHDSPPPPATLTAISSSNMLTVQEVTRTLNIKSMALASKHTCSWKIKYGTSDTDYPL